MSYINFLATLTLLTDVFILLVFFYWLLGNYISLNFLAPIFRFIRKRAILLAFIVAILATSGSLYFSEILNFVPCKLCWYQRIFMYPQVLLLGIASYYKDLNIRKYIIPMCLVGSLISLYNYYLQLFPPDILSCSFNSAESCSQRIVMVYGYITFAVMALSASLLILTTLLIQKYSGHEH